MKAKYILIALLAVSIFGCDDNTGGLGLGMFPGGDRNIKGRLTPFKVTTESVLTGKIYAKTSIGYVGKFTDTMFGFGEYKAGFLAQFNCPDGLTFPEAYKEVTSDGKTSATGVMVASNRNSSDNSDVTFIENAQGDTIGNIRAVELYLLYQKGKAGYFGDSLTACRLSVYELGETGKTLDSDNAYYTDIKPDEYYKPENLLGTKAYTAVDLAVKDSIRNLSTYTPNVYINFKKDIAERVGGNILKAAREAGKSFNKDLFQKAFEGIYVNSDYGDGTVLYINQIQMNVVYKCYATDTITGVKLKNQDGKDSTYYAYRSFVPTREVFQANQLKNDETSINNCINDETCTYLKSPAGIFTEATLPIEDIKNKLGSDTLNAVKLTFTHYNQVSDKKFGMSVPTYVLLIRKKDKDNFFKENKLPDNVSSFYTFRSSTANEYVFGNISRLISTCIAEKKAGTADPDWNKVVLIPIVTVPDPSDNTRIIGVQHDLKPSYVKLKGGKKGSSDDNYKLKLEVISTDFGL